MTPQIIITAVILAVVVYMFFSPRFPNAVVATVGAIAVSLTGTGTKSIQVGAILALIMESGHYTPKDVFKWGLVECLAMILAVVIFIPVFWLR